MTFIPGMQGGGLGAGLSMGTEMRVLRGLVLETGRGLVVLDEAIVAPQGLFVVSALKGSGVVSGLASGAEWILTAADGGKTRIANPLLQNAEKLQILAEHLGLSPEKLRSVVVLSGDVRPGAGLPANVVLKSALPYIRSQAAHVLTGPEMAQIMKALHPPGGGHKKVEHPGAGTIAPVVQGRCPKCGAPLVVEIPRSGENVGRPMRRCSSYPRCRFVSFT